MRILMGILAALLLAACQQPAGNAGAPAGASPEVSGLGSEQFGAGKDGQMHYFRAEGDAVGKELAVALLDACYGEIGGLDKAAFQACLRDRMTQAFDDSGKGRAACDHYGALDAYADCVVIGNMVLQIRHQLQDDSPVGADFWNSKDTMIHAMIKSVVIGATTNCRSAQSELEVMACADEWFAGRLDIPDEYRRRCDANKSDDDREACLGEAVTVQYMRTHMGRISGKAI